MHKDLAKSSWASWNFARYRDWSRIQTYAYEDALFHWITTAMMVIITDYISSILPYSVIEVGFKPTPTKSFLRLLFSSFFDTWTSAWNRSSIRIRHDIRSHCYSWKSVPKKVAGITQISNNNWITGFRIANGKLNFA